MQKKVSVIIPFFNNKVWLEEALESVFHQTYKNIEVILVNDGSPEDISDLLEKYADKIIYLKQENKGPAAARNKAIKLATGDYIAFQDSDDIWMPRKLELQIPFMESTNAKWSHTGFYYWQPRDNSLTECNCRRDFGDIYLQRMVSTQIATPSVVLARSIYQEDDYYFPEGVRNGEDDNLYTKIAKKHPIALINIPLVKVRLRGSNSNSHAIERFHLRKSNYERWKKEGVKMPQTIHLIYSFYKLYAKIFPLSKRNELDLLAKMFWCIPYVIERVYVKYLFCTIKKDSKFLLDKINTTE